jgi:deoxyribonuclease-4
MWDTELGLEHLVAIHVNDSATIFDSHHDKHENIGEGTIGMSGFKHLAQEKRITHLPWVLETPGFDRAGPDAKNISRLAKIAGAV